MVKKLSLIVILLSLSCSLPTQIEPPPKITPTAMALSIKTFTSTPRPSPTPILITPTPIAPTPTPIIYIVKAGDTLAQIATIYDIDVYDLARANNISIDKMNLIQIGQVINIVDPQPITPPIPTILIGKQIIVVPATQRVYAFEDGKLLKEFIVSTGLPDTPTVTGHYPIYVKYRYTDMYDVEKTYFLPDVPFTMYFYLGYGLHGTYWHSNFGRPMSHGCVNLRTDPDAQWLYNWAEIGTEVYVVE